MPSQIALIWALATSAVVLAAGAVAAYWAHPSFLWPHSSPPAIVDRAPEAPAIALANAPAAKPVASAAARAPSAQAAPPIASLTPSARPAAPSSAEAPASSAKPAFDVVSVEPTGEAVVAGRAEPNAKVELRDAGKTVAEATTDAHGQFVIIPPTLTPGGHTLSLASGSGKSAAETSKAVVVTIPAPKAAVAALAPAQKAAPEPAAATLAASAPAAGSRIAIKSVAANANGGLSVKGAADPSGVVRLYLNGAFVADARTKADGLWSLEVEHGMTGGAYTLRADEINPADAKVVARAEAPFSYPAAPPPSLANAPSPAHETPLADATPGARSSANVVVDSLQTDRVVRGDTLWGISRAIYGDGTRYRQIFAANSSQIRDPHWIYPGQLFVVPRAQPKP